MLKSTRNLAPRLICIEDLNFKADELHVVDFYNSADNLNRLHIENCKFPN